MPNRVVPEFWNYDPALCRLRPLTQLFFYRLALAVDDYWRCFIGPSPREPLFLRSTLYPLNPDVRIADVARCLTECQEAGALLIRESDRGWFVEVPERLRYRKEDYSERQPKYGDRIQRAKSEIQTQLPLGPVDTVLPGAEQPARNRPTQRSRSRKKDEVDDELNGNQSPRLLASPTGETRKQGQGNEERFARDEDHRPDDDLWQDLCRLLGPREMLQNGALWERRIRTSRRALCHAVEDFKLKSPDDRAGYNAAAYLTAAI